MSEKKTKDEDFEDKLLIYGAYLQVATCLQHSNRIQLTYKTITSTWLIATLLGAGYSLSSKEVNLPVHPMLIVTLICLASSLVILLIWYLDLIVQEKSIASAVHTGLELETTHEWLPQAYHNVSKMYYLIGYISLKSVFYLGVIAILTIAASSALGFYLFLKGGILWPYMSIVAILVILGFFIFFDRITKKSDPYPVIDKLKNKKGK